jgi:phosphoribosyl 1,2-cyclic phosphodiesterase
MIDIKVLASGSRGNAYLIDDGHTPILLEAGLPWKEIQKKLDFKTSEIKFCLISHEHKDHSKAIKEVMKAGIDVYASRGTINFLGVTGHRLKPIKALGSFTIGTWTILPFETQHDAVEPLGFLLANSAGDKLLFATDTFYCKYKFKGLTHIMVECNYALNILQENVTAGIVDSGLKNRLLSSHFSLANVKEFLKANDLSSVEEIHLIHLSDGNSDAERFKREVMEVTGKAVYVAE